MTHPFDQDHPEEPLGAGTPPASNGDRPLSSTNGDGEAPSGDAEATPLTSHGRRQAVARAFLPVPSLDRRSVLAPPTFPTLVPPAAAAPIPARLAVRTTFLADPSPGAAGAPAPAGGPSPRATLPPSSPPTARVAPTRPGAASVPASTLVPTGSSPSGRRSRPSPRLHPIWHRIGSAVGLLVLTVLVGAAAAAGVLAVIYALLHALIHHGG